MYNNLFILYYFYILLYIVSSTDEKKILQLEPVQQYNVTNNNELMGAIKTLGKYIYSCLKCQFFFFIIFLYSNNICNKNFNCYLNQGLNLSIYFTKFGNKIYFIYIFLTIN